GHPAGPAFECVPDKSLLESALAAGWEIPYSCRRGSCETCRAHVCAGEVSPAAETDGTALLCRTRALSDVTIEVRRAEMRQRSAPKRIKAKIFRTRMLAPDVACVELRFPAGVRARFRAGQYLNICLEGLATRSYSMANTPSQSDGVQLHVRVLPGGRFSEQILPTLKPGDEIPVELPYGDFYLRQDLPQQVVLLAGGTGFAPMQAMLEEALPRHPETRFHLYWGARVEAGLYARERIERWLAAYPALRFIGVLSDSDPQHVHGWRTGLVHEAVASDFESLADSHVYACGAPAMVAAAQVEFTGKLGLPSECFFSDAFVSS
ncbi:MAG: FAD-binding oxidoreductase, partial [Burkholderiaceae bacterium]